MLVDTRPLGLKPESFWFGAAAAEAAPFQIHFFQTTSFKATSFNPLRSTPFFPADSFKTLIRRLYTAHQAIA
jgi:hypothetical protein